MWQLLINYVYPIISDIRLYFLSDCPSQIYDVAIRYVQYCQAMLERGICELAHSFFHCIG